MFRKIVRMEKRINSEPLMYNLAHASFLYHNQGVVVGCQKLIYERTNYMKNGKFRHYEKFILEFIFVTIIIISGHKLLKNFSGPLVQYLLYVKFSSNFFINLFF